MNAQTLFFRGVADAYLEWAHHTQYRHFHKLRSNNSAAGLIGLLVEVVQKPEPLSAENGQGYTFRSTVRTIEELGKLPGTSLEKFKRIELASPVAAERIAEGDPNFPPLGGQGPVIGIIDDGCPYAKADFLEGGISRVARLWDQNPVPGDTHERGSYGRRLTSKDLAEAMAAHPGDDLAAYERLSLPNLRRRATHGAHVMDVFAGSVPARSRVSPSRMRLETEDGSATEAPSWARPADEASKASIVFVQLPEAAIDDPTGRWLGRNVLDGVDYIVKQAKKTTPRIVVNISWGPQTGPHDGSGLLERALAQRVEGERGRLSIVLPAGNSYEARAHAQFSLEAGCSALEWHVPPGSETPSFLEIWWPANAAIGEVGITVTSPRGDSFSFEGQSQGGILSLADQSWGITVVPHEQRYMALLALAPNFSHEGGVNALHGKWSISVRGAPNSPVKDALVHVYVARSSANMGGKRGAKDSYLFDPRYDPDRHARPSREDNADSLVKREGTLNGIAGARTLVAAGYVLSKGADPAAPYSSSGPQPGSKPGRNPDWALPTDESPFLQGVLAGGVRSGSAIRLVGTSTAAPQLARKIANGELNLPLKPEPRQPAPISDPRLGKGAIPMSVTKPDEVR